MDQSAGVDIKNKKLESFSAPTPQNTPSNPAPITSDYRPTVTTISEDMETVTTPGVAGTDASALSGAFTNNPALISMLQGKLDTLVGRPSGYIESLPPAVQRRINGLKYLQLSTLNWKSNFKKKYWPWKRSIWNSTVRCMSSVLK
ncbi:unnamed protein product [Absidia cylindrospora]